MSTDRAEIYGASLIMQQGEMEFQMPRTLKEIIAHIRMVVANPQVSTTLVQTEDLEVLCDAAERTESCDPYSMLPPRERR